MLELVLSTGIVLLSITLTWMPPPFKVRLAQDGIFRGSWKAKLHGFRPATMVVITFVILLTATLYVDKNKNKARELRAARAAAIGGLVGDGVMAILSMSRSEAKRYYAMVESGANRMNQTRSEAMTGLRAPDCTPAAARSLLNMFATDLEVHIRQCRTLRERLAIQTFNNPTSGPFSSASLNAQALGLLGDLASVRARIAAIEDMQPVPAVRDDLRSIATHTHSAVLGDYNKLVDELSRMIAQSIPGELHPIVRQQVLEIFAQAIKAE